MLRAPSDRPVPVTWLDPVAASPIEVAVSSLLLVGIGLIGLVWGAATLSSWLINGVRAEVGLTEAVVAITRMGANRFTWSGTWSPETEAQLAGPAWFWIIFAAEVLLVAVVFWPIWRLLGPRVADPQPVVVMDRPQVHPRTARRRAAHAARQERQQRQRAQRAPATPAASDGVTVEPPPRAPGIDKILVDQADGQRLILGRVGTDQLVATEKHHSVLALGPTRSGKTSGLALPAVLEWDGPVIVVSAKSDLVATTWTERSRLDGACWLFDPASSLTGGGGDQSDLPPFPTGGHGWSPLETISDIPQARHELDVDRRIRQWALARQSARWMIGEGEWASSGMPATWYATAEQMLAPMLLAAGALELPLAQLQEWIDRRADAEISDALANLEVSEAMATWDGARHHDAEARAGGYQILSALIYPFSDPVVLAQARDPLIRADRFFNGAANSLFVVAPTHHQERLRPLLSTLVSEMMDTGMSRASSAPNGRLERPLLLVIDDTAACLPLGLLDQLASMGAGLGIQVLTVLQDLGHLSQRHGAGRAAGLANDHRARVVLPGITDGATLEYLNDLIRGNRLLDPAAADMADDDAVVSQTATWLRTLEDGAAVLIYGNLAPMRIALRPWFGDPGLNARVNPEPEAETPSRMRWWRRQHDELEASGFPNPLDSEANDAEAQRYWDSVLETGLLPEQRPYDSGDL